MQGACAGGGVPGRCLARSAQPGLEQGRRGHRNTFRQNPPRRRQCRVGRRAAAPVLLMHLARRPFAVTHVCVCRDVTTGGSDKVGEKEVKEFGQVRPCFLLFSAGICGLRPAPSPRAGQAGSRVTAEWLVSSKR